MEKKVRKVKQLWFVLVGLVLITSPAMAELSVAVVNAAAVLDAAPQKKQALARLEKEFSSRSKTIEEKIKALRAKQEKLVQDGAIYAAAEKKRKERAIMSEKREIERLQDEYSEDLSIRRNEELRRLEKQVSETIVELAKKKAYDIVLYQGVIFASDKVDITQAVIQLLNEK